MWGHGPCDNCGGYVEHTLLTGESSVNPLLGRLYYPAVPGQGCPHCGVAVHGITAFLPEQLVWDLSKISIPVVDGQ